MQIKKFTFNPFQENTYLVYDEQGKAAIIDPGCYERLEKDVLKSFIEENHLELVAILQTHSHLDHIFGCAFVKRNWKVKHYGHRLDLQTFELGPRSAQLYGIPNFEVTEAPEHLVEDGDEIQIGSMRFQVLFAPGHAPGHICFYAPEDACLFGGDVLFQGSFGRTDLPGGSMAQLKASITQRLFSLPDDTVVRSGHGPKTTIGEERKSNPIWQY